MSERARFLIVREQVPEYVFAAMPRQKPGGEAFCGGGVTGDARTEIGGHGAGAVADNGTRRCNPDGRWGDCNASPAHTIDFDWSDYTPCTNEPGDPQCQPTLRANVSACRDPEMPERSCNTDADCSGPKRCGLHTDSQGGAFWKGSCVWICPDKRPNPSGEPGDPIAPPGFGGPSGACFNGN